MAIWHHISSSDDEPDHDLCPSGKDSWCGYQRDIACETSTYSHKNALPIAVCNEILPVFEALSEEQLLKACLHGRTQNQKRSMH